MALSTAIFSFMDYSMEKSVVTLDMGLPADGTEWEANQTLIDALAVAFKALSLCNLNYYGQRTIQNDQDGEPSNVEAQRESGIRFFWRETSGDDPKKGNFTLPGPDKSIAVSNHSDDIDLTITEIGAIVGAVEAVWNASLPVNREIYRARLVGRKS